jgi:arylsulfatase A-like enzyme
MKFHSLSVTLSLLLGASAWAQTATPKRNAIIFVADGLRAGSVNATDAPTMFSIRNNGVYFSNSHSLFPTFTTPNASAIATGHYLGDTGDFSNTVFVGFPIYNDGLFGKTSGTLTPFLENNQVLADVDRHFRYNYLTEETLLALARRSGYSTAAVGKVGPVGIQDPTQLIASGTTLQVPQTVIVDDSTGSLASPPYPSDVLTALTAAGLSTTATARNQPSGNLTTAGTTAANLGQQQYFADSLTKAILPTFKQRPQPFVVVFWSRDPDGSQHNQGDSLNTLTPGINGPTSKAAVKNADTNLKQILDYINSDATLAANTDIFITADHGFATISKHEIDNAGGVSKSFSTTITYKDTTGTQEVKTGWLPAGFLAIDLANTLSLPLFDPDSLSADGKSYLKVDWTAPQSTATLRQRPASGNGIIGGTGAVQDVTDATIVIAANGGSDLVYVPGHDLKTVTAVANFLATQDYVGGLFVNDRYGSIPGTLPMSSINLIGNTIVPTPDIAVNFKTFAVDATNPLMTAVQIADSTLQEGQGMHGTLSRDNTFNNMAAIGPDFKTKYVDISPVSNADIVPTIAKVLGLPLGSIGALQGRVISEALVGNPDNPLLAQKLTKASDPAANGNRTVLLYQTLGSQLYFDEARLLNGAGTLAIASPKGVQTTSRDFVLDGTGSTAFDNGVLTYAWTQTSGPSAALTATNTSKALVQFQSPGAYGFKLTVTDSAGISSSDTLTVTYYGR